MKDIGRAPEDYKKLEAKWQKFWRKNKIYKFNPKSKKPLYSVDTPPPYISGRIHMGHGASYTMFETIARFKRMTGHNVFFPMGFDDNGLPTERYVEKKLKIKAKDMSRQEFIKIALKETKILEEVARKSFDQLGHSYDWDLFYSTISPYAAKTAQKSFLDLVKKKRAYRSNEPGLFCTYCRTAISQADLEEEKRGTTLNYINFKTGDGKKVEIATTRPELLASCVAIYVNPKDKRYESLLKKKIEVPLFGQKVPVKTDATVDMEFGSGAMMVCTFGDKADVEKWKKDKLPLAISINEDGTLNERASNFQGEHFRTAREGIIDALKQKGHLIKQEKLKQTLAVHDRCSNPPEYISSHQWMLKLIDLKKDILKKAKRVNWVPKHFYNNFKTWTENLAWDWTLSRQRHIGIPIPVWYTPEGTVIYPSETELPVDPTVDLPKSYKGDKKKLIGESAVFDTWMTSSLTPEINFNWAKSKSRVKIKSPMSMRPQGYDIIRTWAFYTVLKSLIHHDSIPWNDLVVNGMILDPQGRKMSKSRGNGIDPIEMADKYNSDSFRYWTTTYLYGENSPFQEKEFKRGVKLMNKLWNTTRFLFMNLDSVPKSKPKKLEIEDKWILSRLVAVRDSYLKNFEKYQSKYARHELEMFFLHEFCDYYLEMIKGRIYGKDKNSKYAAQWTAYNTLYSVLQLFAPILCHLTEDLYQKQYKKEKGAKSIHLTEFDKFGKKDKDAESAGKLAKDIIAEVRQWKQKNKIKLGDQVDHLVVSHTNPKTKSVLDLVARTMRISRIEHKKGKFHISK